MEGLDYIRDATRRSGLMGVYEMGLNARQDIQYGGIGITDFAGPTVQQATEFTQALFGEGDRFKTFQRALPANNLWRGWINE